MLLLYPPYAFNQQNKAEIAATRLPVIHQYPVFNEVQDPAEVFHVSDVNDLAPVRQTHGTSRDLIRHQQAHERILQHCDVLQGLT